MRAVIVSCLAAVMLAGCGSRPIYSYRPIVDMRGVPQSNYENDLAECQEYADSFTPGRGAVIGALAGAVLGAAVTKAVGGSHADAVAVARGAAIMGGVQGAAAGASTGAQIVDNCLAGRGYRPLQANMVVVQAAPAPLPAPLPTPSASPAATMVPAVYEQPAARAGGTSVAIDAWGMEARQAEGMPVARLCASQPKAILVQKEAAIETYAIACDSGSQIRVQCEINGVCMQEAKLTASAPSVVAQPAPVVAPPALAPGAHGRESYTVERLAEVRACHAQPRAVLSAKGAGFEAYTVACANGDALQVRCDFGNCRVLK